MIFKIHTGLMVFTMSFFISAQAIAQEAKKKSKPEAVEKETSQVMSAASRKIRQHSLGIGMGQTFLMGSFENKGDDKITVDVLYAYTASYSFDLLINFHRSNHEYKSKKVNLSGASMSIKARSYEFDAFSPYVLGGLGFYQPQIEKDGEQSEIKNTFGINAGGGVDLRLNDKIAIGIMAQYHKPFDIKQDETETVSGSYFKLLLTAMYLF